MPTPPFHVLFLCTGNSARSLMAECALVRWGGKRFGSFSAGSHPKAAPHPRTLELLAAEGFEVSRLRSKSWEEFAQPGAPELHIVITVCDAAAGESCPVWPGRPVTAHWGVPDPAAATGSDGEIAAAFRRAYDALEARVLALTRLPLEELEPAQVSARLAAIARGEDDAS